MFQISKTFFVSLVLFAILGILPPQAEAQSGRVPQTTQPTLANSTVTVCLNEAEGGVYRLTSGTACAQGYRDFLINTAQTPYACVYRGTANWEIQVGSDQAAGQQACAAANGRFFTIMTNMSTTAPAPTAPTTPTTPTPGQNPTPSTNPGPTRTQLPPASQGNCDPEFEQQGALCVPKRQTCDGFVCAQTVGDLVASILRILLMFAGIVAVVFAVIGGYQIMTASSNETQATDGKKTLRNALIGLAIVIVSYALITILIDLLTNNV